MMFVSILPAIAYYIGYSLMISSMYSGRKNDGNNGAAFGIVFMAFSFIMNLFTLYLSRLREYYADRHSAATVENGPQKLSTGLAKIVNATKNVRMTKKDTQNLHAFKALFIADPDCAQIDSAQLSAMSVGDSQKLVDGIISKKLTGAERIKEIFSTHPNIIKRLRALRGLN
jgi:heat shock protein HtpX